MGNVLKINFWNEVWSGDVKMRVLVLDLYSISLQQNNTIAQMWSPQGWNLMFRSALNDWEFERVTNLFQVLNPFLGINAEPDKPVWKLQSRGVFTVKSHKVLLLGKEHQPFFNSLALEINMED